MVCNVIEFRAEIKAGCLREVQFERANQSDIQVVISGAREMVWRRAWHVAKLIGRGIHEGSGVDVADASQVPACNALAPVFSVLTGIGAVVGRIV